MNGKICAAAALWAWALTGAGHAMAEPPAPTVRIAKPAPWAEIPLARETRPDAEIWDDWHGTTIVRNVTNPTLTPVLPAPGKATGTAVVVIPGGGFHFLSMTNEGWPIARWLADQGIAAFVLKYRVEPTPPDEAGFDRILPERFTPSAWIGGTPAYLEKTARSAREDAQAALRLIRARAGEWGVNPARVGVLGFSAGAITVVNLAVADASDARPDFVGALYGHMLPVTPPARPQPLFLAVADDDVAFAKQGVGLVDSWRKAGGSVELHWYEGGGHGFGSQKMGTTSDQWFTQFVGWLRARKFID